MADRREDETIRTDRPVGSVVDDGLPTVREILTLDAVAHGVPEVLSGDDALDARVRWVHVSDSAGVARLLNGGELLLSTGSGWPTEPRELEAFIAELVDAGIAGLVLELGVHYRYVPAVVEAAAREHGLALVALHREVKFVALTEAVHSRIISEQTAALRARDEVRERFTALSLRGSPADFIVHQLAQTLGAAVVLENLAHEVVASEVPPAAEEELFTSWEVRSRLAHRQHEDRRGRSAAAGLDEWLIVPVEARGIRWGHLIALPGPAHPAGRASVLEQGAIALALGRLADGDADEWVRIGRQRLVDGLLAGRFAGLGGAAARLEAAGLPVDGAHLYGVVATGAPISPGRRMPPLAPSAAVRSTARGATPLGRPPRPAPPASCCCRCPSSCRTPARASSHPPSSTATRHPSTDSFSRWAARPPTSTGCSARCRRRSTWPGARASGPYGACCCAAPTPARSCDSSPRCATTIGCCGTASGCWRRSSTTTSRAAATC